MDKDHLCDNCGKAMTGTEYVMQDGYCPLCLDGEDDAGDTCTKCGKPITATECEEQDGHCEECCNVAG